MSQNRNSDAREYIDFKSAEEFQKHILSTVKLVPIMGSRATLLLPTLESVLNLIGIKASLPSFIIKVSEHKKKSLPFSRATLYNLCTGQAQVDTFN